MKSSDSVASEAVKLKERIHSVWSASNLGGEVTEEFKLGAN